MIDPLFQKSQLEAAIHDLRKDLLFEGGPRISTMRNYGFAILPYDPGKEFELRGYIRRLIDELSGMGWNLLFLSLHRIFMDMLKSEEPGVLDSFIGRERRLHAKDAQRGLQYLKERMVSYIEEPDGIASVMVRRIDAFVEEHPDEMDKALILIGRAGALYPYFRYSALLRFLDGKTRNIPVVLLYPGERQGETGLTFMGELPADRDYRPRIYS